MVARGERPVWSSFDRLNVASANFFIGVAIEGICFSKSAKTADPPLRKINLTPRQATWRRTGPKGDSLTCPILGNPVTALNISHLAQRKTGAVCSDFRRDEVVAVVPSSLTTHSSGAAFPQYSPGL